MAMARKSSKSKDAAAARARRVAGVLAELYPEARISLDFADGWQCLVATILSAQCTDERVNQVTPELFRKLPDPSATAAAPLETIEQMIASTGFFRQKAKSLKGAATEIAKRFSGRVPERMEDLVTLPGVGRKTANVVLGHVYGQPGMVVDTHVKRVAYRLGFTTETNPDEIERDLQSLLPAREWTAFSMRLILHGRRVCVARKPRCEDCRLSPVCPRVGVKP